MGTDHLLFMSDSVEGLKKQVDGVFEFCKKSQMIFNSLKKVMIIGRRSVCNPGFLFNHVKRHIVDEYKYLRVVINTEVMEIFKNKLSHTVLKKH